jgi:hypothetical protein
MANISRLRAVLMHNTTLSAWIPPLPWYIGHIPQTPEVPYYYYKLVTNVIRAVKIHVLS